MRPAYVIAATLAASAVAASAVPAFGADSGTVNAQVTVASPCITLSTATIDFGSLPFRDPTGGPSAGTATPDVAIENCSSTAEDLFVRGTDATGATAAWELTDANFVPPNTLNPTCSLGPDKYNLIGAEANLAWSGLVLTTVDKLAASVGGGATVTASHAINMPCAGSSGAGETVTMQIVYTAAF